MSVKILAGAILVVLASFLASLILGALLWMGKETFGSWYKSAGLIVGVFICVIAFIGTVSWLVERAD